MIDFKFTCVVYGPYDYFRSGDVTIAMHHMIRAVIPLISWQRE